MSEKNTKNSLKRNLYIGLIFTLGVSFLSPGYSISRSIERIIAAKPVNINYANEEQLLRLKGVGSKRAKSIIAYRTQHGRFKKLNDVNNVPGLGENFLFENRGLITLSDNLY